MNKHVIKIGKKLSFKNEEIEEKRIPYTEKSKLVQGGHTHSSRTYS